MSMKREQLADSLAKTNLVWHNALTKRHPYSIHSLFRLWSTCFTWH